MIGIVDFYARLDELTERVLPVCGLGVSIPEGLSRSDRVGHLRIHYTQYEIRVALNRGMRLLDTFDHDSAEADLLMDLLDDVYYAIDKESRP